MANKMRNEMEIKLGGETILLRPTFENVASMEANVGSLAYLSFKFSRGLGQGKGEGAKSLPSMTETAQIIFYNQASVSESDITKKKFSLEQIFELCMDEGFANLALPVMKFLSLITLGNKFQQKVETMTEEEKKS